MTRIIIIFLYIHVFTLVSTMGNNLRCTCHPPRRAPLITDHNAPVLVSAAWIIENDLQAVHLLRQLREKPTLYERLPIRKMLQSYRLSPYTQFQAEGPYYFKAPDLRGQNYWGGVMSPPWTFSKSSFTHMTRHSPPLSQLMIKVG